MKFVIKNNKNSIANYCFGGKCYWDCGNKCGGNSNCTSFWN